MIAAGGEAVSDPVQLEVKAPDDLVISIYLPDSTGPATQHYDLLSLIRNFGLDEFRQECE